MRLVTCVICVRSVVPKGYGLKTLPKRYNAVKERRVGIKKKKKKK